MSTDTRYQIKFSRLSHQAFEDETVVVDLDSGSYYSMNQVAGVIWCLLEQPQTVDELTAQVARRYEGSLLEIRTEVSQFLTALQQAELVEAVEGATHSGTDGIPEPPPLPSVKPPFAVPVLSSYTDMQELLALDPIHEVDETGWPSVPVETPRASD